MTSRLPAHVEVSALVRAAQEAGGFAMVIAKGERDAGTLAVITLADARNARFWERMPQLDGSRRFEVSREQDTENPEHFTEYVMRRSAQDPDLWVVELECAAAEQILIDTLG